MNKFAAALALTLGLTVTGSAFAALQDRNRCEYGSVACGDVLEAGDSWVGFNNILKADFESFQHDYFIWLDDPVVLSGTIMNFTGRGGDIDGLTLEFWVNPDGVIADDGNEFMIFSTPVNGSFTGSLVPADYAGLGNSFFYRVTGDVSGNVYGQYKIDVAVTAVPEPEVWATMALGLGLIGLRLRGRSERKVSA